MDACTARKCHAPLNDNGEPVTVPIPKRWNASEQTGKKKAVSTIPSKTAPQKKVVLTKRKPSVKMEEVPEEDNLTHPGPPQNPQNILEASDGSDNNNTFGPPSSAAMDISDDEDEIEKPEEADKAELGLPVSSLNI
jgi:hypothetical protein